MSILGSPPDEYTEYAHNIRLEYQHIPLADYCIGRSSFLKTIVSNSRDQHKSIFLTKEFCDLYESQMIVNVEYEINLLENKIIPGEKLSL